MSVWLSGWKKNCTRSPGAAFTRAGENAKTSLGVPTLTACVTPPAGWLAGSADAAGIKLASVDDPASTTRPKEKMSPANAAPL